MKVMVTGHRGYIGAVLTPMLRERGHEVLGLDCDLYRDCDFIPGGSLATVPEVRGDLRDLKSEWLEGCEAVVHLAALSNDPLGDLEPELTYDINLHASVALAKLAKRAGIQRFLYSSSCSVYGAAGDAMLDESAAFNPVTPYGASKIQVELALSALADRSFCPSYLRNATAYGVSPRLRMDLVLNDLVSNAVETGEIVVKSDGTPWRPLVHVRDISSAFIAVLESDEASVWNEAFNVGRTGENFRVSQLAERVAEAVPGSHVSYAASGGPDPRSYRVNFNKLSTVLPGFQPQWTVEKGIEELVSAFRVSPHRLGGNDAYIRLKTIRRRLSAGELDETLRERTPEPVA